jgi:hypothetical protein
MPTIGKTAFTSSFSSKLQRKMATSLLSTVKTKTKKSVREWIKEQQDAIKKIKITTQAPFSDRQLCSRKQQPITKCQKVILKSVNFPFESNLWEGRRLPCPPIPHRAWSSWEFYFLVLEKGHSRKNEEKEHLKWPCFLESRTEIKRMN